MANARLHTCLCRCLCRHVYAHVYAHVHTHIGDVRIAVGLAHGRPFKTQQTHPSMYPQVYVRHMYRCTCGWMDGCVDACVCVAVCAVCMATGRNVNLHPLAVLAAPSIFSLRAVARSACMHPATLTQIVDVAAFAPGQKLVCLDRDTKWRERYNSPCQQSWDTAQIPNPA